MSNSLALNLGHLTLMFTVMKVVLRDSCAESDLPSHDPSTADIQTTFDHLSYKVMGLRDNDHANFHGPNR